jgi:hypothetical protein
LRIELQRLVFRFGLEKSSGGWPGLFCVFLGILNAVLGKVMFWAWCFDGEVVVFCVVKVGI